MSRKMCFLLNGISDDTDRRGDIAGELRQFRQCLSFKWIVLKTINFLCFSKRKLFICVKYKH